jgi:glycerol kinase
MAEIVGAVDQGTTSTRFIVFDHGDNQVGKYQSPASGNIRHSRVRRCNAASARLLCKDVHLEGDRQCGQGGN